MSETIQFTLELPVSPERVYRAWLDSYEHSRFTGSPAKIDPAVGGEYSAWDGYISGKTLAATPYNHIVQTWRTTEFPPGSPDSEVDLKIESTCLGSQVILNQKGIPDGQSRAILEGWEEYYFRPLLAYFEEIVGDSTVDMDG